MSMGVQNEQLPEIGEGTEGQPADLYTVIMSLCDTEVKNQVRALEGYREFDKTSTQ